MRTRLESKITCRADRHKSLVNSPVTVQVDQAGFDTLRELNVLRMWVLRLDIGTTSGRSVPISSETPKEAL